MGALSLPNSKLAKSQTPVFKGDKDTSIQTFVAYSKTAEISKSHIFNGGLIFQLLFLCLRLAKSQSLIFFMG